MTPTHGEVVAAMQVLESEIGTTDMKWLRSLTIDMLTAAEKERVYDILGEPKICPSADE